MQLVCTMPIPPSNSVGTNHAQFHRRNDPAETTKQKGFEKQEAHDVAPLWCRQCGQCNANSPPGMTHIQNGLLTPWIVLRHLIARRFGTVILTLKLSQPDLPSLDKRSHFRELRSRVSLTIHSKPHPLNVVLQKNSVPSVEGTWKLVCLWKKLAFQAYYCRVHVFDPITTDYFSSHCLQHCTYTYLLV